MIEIVIVDHVIVVMGPQGDRGTAKVRARRLQLFKHDCVGPQACRATLLTRVFSQLQIAVRVAGAPDSQATTHEHLIATLSACNCFCEGLFPIRLVHLV